MFHASAKRIMLSALALAAAGPAFAHGFDRCTEEPKEKWKPQAEAEAAATAAGYTVTKSRIEGSCYEVHAKDKDGKKYDLSYSPFDLSLVDKHGD